MSACTKIVPERVHDKPTEKHGHVVAILTLGARFYIPF